MKYKRALIKISGEALAGDKHTGYDMAFVTKLCQQLKKLEDSGAEICLVIGGGNFWRGLKDGQGKVERVSADKMGMLATVMNGLAVADVLRKCGAKVKLMTSFAMEGIGERIDATKAKEYLSNGNIVIMAGGTGMPYVSTDTAAVLRALETESDIILLAKNIDGVYSADPGQDPTAKKYDEVSYEEVLDKKLRVMDLTATSMAMDNGMKSMVFAVADPENIEKALNGENIGTLVK